jgi:hypothetical protein
MKKRINYRLMVKWLFTLVLLFTMMNGVDAQIASPPQPRDSAFMSGRTSRSTFNSWDIIRQKDFLLIPGFVIYDIINAQPYNFLNPPDPDQYYITDWDFYQSILDKQLEILHKPQTYIVFPDAHNTN